MVKKVTVINAISESKHTQPQQRLNRYRKHDYFMED